MTKRNILHISVFVFMVALLAMAPVTDIIVAQEEVELQDKIKERGRELRALNAKINQTQGQVANLQNQGQTLQNTIRTINIQINQVNYGIRSSEINIEKLGLELRVLGFDLEDVAEAIVVKRVAVAEILRQVQQKDGDGLLEVMLKNETLADSVFEIQSLRDVQNNLSIGVVQLTELGNKLKSNMGTTATKRGKLENENTTLGVRKEILADQEQEKEVILTETKNEESLYQLRLSALRSEQKKILDEIVRTESGLRAKFDPLVVPPRRPGLLTWPIKLAGSREPCFKSSGIPGGIGIVTQCYGKTPYSDELYGGRPHNGIDIGAPIGTEIYAAAGGKVVHVGYNAWYGNYIMIKHDNNLTTLYAHLSRSITSLNARVERGQLIGYVGNTGFSTGPHLHFTIYATPPGGWTKVSSRNQSGFVRHASGLVPIGVTFNPTKYL